jgi:hypothetical protein
MGGKGLRLEGNAQEILATGKKDYTEALMQNLRQAVAQPR